ncbi:outer membrane beta-barrel protein [Fulvivirgaceae bacterium PWU5]|uniref:Outer membrane beta-barrel protein n=2 Tax=Dawidia cretensis TaxID=2782350 RepID=A0AAP2DYI5_9BACT|nr:outer membrane beta-barrel protein [Dawidia cretensis]
MESRKFEDAFKRAFDEAGVSPSDNVWTNIERILDDTESRKVEGVFRQTFDGAGVNPSENVWTNIELDLMKAEGGKMRRRLVFYQLLAAASITFALGVAGMGYYLLKDRELTGAAGQLAYQEQPAGANNNNNTTATTPTVTGDTHQELSQGTTATSGVGVDGQQTQDVVTGITLPNNITHEGDIQTQTAVTETSQTPLTQSATTQRNGMPTQQAMARQEAQRNRMRTTDGQDIDPLKADGSRSNQGQTSADQQTLAAANDADAGSSDAQQQHARVTTQQANTADARLSTQGRNGVESDTPITSENGQPQLAVTQQRSGATSRRRVGDATNAETTAIGEAILPGQLHNGSDKQTTSSDRIGEDNVRLAQTNETTATRRETVVANGSQRTETSNNAVTTDGATATTITTTPTADQQTGYILAYSPVPSEATPVVTSIGTRVQKPASMKVEPASTVDPLMALLARLDEQEKNANAKEKKDKHKDEEFDSEKLWTSVGFAAGSFNNVNSSVASSSGSLMMADARSSAVDDVAKQQANASGSSYSVGVNLGARISSRWVLQGGINYMTQASDYVASAIGTADYQNFSAPSANSIMSADKQSAEYASQVVPTAPYNVNNSMQFVSVPLQAGYLLVNRKVGVQLNGGLSTDLFLQNTITPESDRLEKTTEGSGSNSPYRTVNFSGLVGTELSYRFSKHYRLALNPGLRYPLNSIYKSDQPVTAAPMTFDIGLRFRYIFH